MTILKKPYIFIIIFIGLILNNVLIVEAVCIKSYTKNFGYCHIENCYNQSGKVLTCVYGKCEWFDYDSRGYMYCYGDPSCRPASPYQNSGPKCDYTYCQGTCVGGGPPGGPTPIVDCEACSDTYRFAKKHWRAYSNCSGSIVPNSTYYTRDCSCSMYDNNDNLLACYPNENYDSQCRP
ncbi:MAG TPA: hypothetical protein PLA57_00230, partial [Candidatus Paceibacterota bacterium]|nr:hypothetical protein [Candidatus Paceibacterota bacterium]